MRATLRLTEGKTRPRTITGRRFLVIAGKTPKQIRKIRASDDTHVNGQPEEHSIGHNGAQWLISNTIIVLNGYIFFCRAVASAVIFEFLLPTSAAARKPSVRVRVTMMMVAGDCVATANDPLSGITLYLIAENGKAAKYLQQ